MSKRAVITAVCIIIIIILYKFSYLEKRGDEPIGELVFKQIIKECLETYSPGFVYIMANSDVDMNQIVFTGDCDEIEDIKSIEETIATEVAIETECVIETGDVVETKMDLEIYSEMEETIDFSDEFVPVTSSNVSYSLEELMDVQFVRKTFYSEDSTTKIFDEQITYDKLTGFDASLKQTNDLPQILIYHTHSQEAYADSVYGNVSDTIVGVGEYLAQILRDEYGFNVIHHTGQYDIDGRDYAYSRAMEGVSLVLENNPSVEVVIDLHRDATKEDTHLVTTIQGIEMAQFMFFNGLCYTKELGNLENLPNPYIQENLSFSFQMQLFANEHYPGLARRIYLKGYRYNMHFRAKSLLIELGSQTNTVLEAMNSCEPIAHIIATVLNG